MNFHDETLVPDLDHGSQEGVSKFDAGSVEEVTSPSNKMNQDIVFPSIEKPDRESTIQHHRKRSSIQAFTGPEQP